MYTTDNMQELWKREIYNALPEHLNEKDLVAWGFYKSLHALRQDRQEGFSPLFRRNEEGQNIYLKDDLVRWSEVSSKPGRILSFPKQEKKKYQNKEEVQLTFFD